MKNIFIRKLKRIACIVLAGLYWTMSIGLLHAGPFPPALQKSTRLPQQFKTIKDTIRHGIIDSARELGAEVLADFIENRGEAESHLWDEGLVKMIYLLYYTFITEQGIIPQRQDVPAIVRSCEQFYFNHLMADGDGQKRSIDTTTNLGMTGRTFMELEIPELIQHWGVTQTGAGFSFFAHQKPTHSYEEIIKRQGRVKSFYESPGRTAINATLKQFQAKEHILFHHLGVGDLTKNMFINEESPAGTLFQKLIHNMVRRTSRVSQAIAPSAHTAVNNAVNNTVKKNVYALQAAFLWNSLAPVRSFATRICGLDLVLKMLSEHKGDEISLIDSAGIGNALREQFEWGLMGFASPSRMFKRYSPQEYKECLNAAEADREKKVRESDLSDAIKLVTATHIADDYHNGTVLYPAKQLLTLPPRAVRYTGNGIVKLVERFGPRGFSIPSVSIPVPGVSIPHVVSIPGRSIATPSYIPGPSDVAGYIGHSSMSLFPYKNLGGLISANKGYDNFDEFLDDNCGNYEGYLKKGSIILTRLEKPAPHIISHLESLDTMSNAFYRMYKMKHYLTEYGSFVAAVEEVSKTFREHLVTQPYVKEMDLFLKNPDLKEFRALLKTDTFTDGSYVNEKDMAARAYHGVAKFFYNYGRVIRACQLLNNVNSDLMRVVHIIGEVDAYCTVATVMHDKQSALGLPIVFADFIDTEKSVFDCKNMWMAGAMKSTPVANNITLGTDTYKANKGIITGPTGAGKTVFLRTVGQAVYLMSTWGCVPAEHAQVSMFDYLMSCFPSLEDMKSGNSRFMQAKQDMEKTSAFIAAAHDKKVMLLVDEPFSGTQEGDKAIRTYAFAESITGYANLMCLLATHVEKPTILAESMPDIFSNYQPEIIEVTPGEFQNTYKILPGPARWWFTDQERVLRYSTWLSHRNN